MLITKTDNTTSNPPNVKKFWCEKNLCYIKIVSVIFWIDNIKNCHFNPIFTKDWLFKQKYNFPLGKYFLSSLTTYKYLLNFSKTT